jgi:hypothetical protein
VPLIVPAAGSVITDFLRRWYGSDFCSRMSIVASIGDIAAEGRLPGGPDLRLVELGADFSPMMELVTGTFARRGERAAFSPAHPLNLLWQAFADEVASGNPYAL